MISEVSSVEQDRISTRTGLPNLEEQTLQRKMQRFFEPNTNPVSHHNNRNLEELLERQTQLMENHQHTINKLTTSMDLPNREIPYFDGNPANYLKFMRSFEMNVEERIFDSSTRLSYLIQYTVGTAKEAIENCIILLEKEAYLKAKEILRKNIT